MDFFEALILGIVQGLTEFLPVSSSGHIVLLQDIFGIDQGTVIFNVMLHFATLLAVGVYFFKDILNLFKPPFKTLGLLIIATIPAAVVMLLFKNDIEILFTSTYICFGFLLTAIVLYTTEYIDKKSKITTDNTNVIDPKKSLVMGIAQAVAVIPGISRSGSTICAGILAGGGKKSVAKFSFFMSMPVILGSAIVSAFEIGQASLDILPLFVGMAAAFLTALLAIRIMMKIIQKSNYKWFALYLAIISVVTFINTFVTEIW